MDDINKAISDIMADPKKLQMLQGMASQLFGDEKPQQSVNVNQGGNSTDDILSNAKNLGSLISAAGSFGSYKNDSSVQLLLALKPHLKDERKIRVDQAVKILQLIKLAPILKDSGLINL